MVDEEEPEEEGHEIEGDAGDALAGPARAKPPIILHSYYSSLSLPEPSRIPACRYPLSLLVASNYRHRYRFG